MSELSREEKFDLVAEALAAADLYFNRQIEALATSYTDPRSRAAIVRSMSPMIAVIGEARDILKELRTSE